MKHLPVLLKECIDGLDIKPDGIYIDGTLGRGGHAYDIAKRLTTGRLIAIDCDSTAISETKKLLAVYEGKITYVCGNYRETTRILGEENIEAADGMLFDLGVSSPQLDDESRGFSYKQNARLDMRMDRANPLDAYTIINTMSSRQLAGLFYEYGEERYARQIARAVVNKRESTNKPIETTFELNEVILSAIPAKARREAQHPSKRVFQALRIAVGDELGALREMLDTAPFLLKPGGRICVISFHSLEDRIVKKSFAEHSKTCQCPVDYPVCMCNLKPVLKQITRKPVTAGPEELKMNPRSRSAKLRIAQRV